MSDLATATCGADLVDGDPGALRLDAVTLEARGRLFGRIADLRIEPAWEGSAADRFRDRLAVTVEKARYGEAAALNAAAALRAHADVLEWSREQAEGALALWRRGAYCVPDTDPGLGTSTLAPEQVSAVQALEALRAGVKASAVQTARILNESSEQGPGGLFATWWRPFESYVTGPPANPWRWDDYVGARGVMDGAIVIPPLRPGVRPVPEVKLGDAASLEYRNTFFDAHPQLAPRSDYWVHHAIEQRVLTRYKGLFTEAEIHSLENLRGVHISVNNDLHLSKIRKMWNVFYREHPPGSGVTKQDFLDWARHIDQVLGDGFTPPVVP